MADLTDLSTKALEVELKRRKDAEVLLPKPLPDPDFDILKAMLNDGIQSLAKNGYPGKDFEHYVFEAAMEAVYGRNVWKWMNSVDRS